MKWLEHEVGRQEGKYGTQKLETNIFPGRDFPFESVACQDESTRLKIFLASICLSRDFSLAASSDGNRHPDCVRDVTQVKDWLAGRTGLLKKPPSFRSAGLPARCPSRRSTPARSMTPGETPPSRSTSPQRRASSGIRSCGWNIFWQFLFNKLTKKVFVFQD